jgi:hypothetical protein
LEKKQYDGFVESMGASGSAYSDVKDSVVTEVAALDL